MATAQDAAAVRFERITVYVDLAAEAQLLPVIATCAASLAPECVIVTQKDISAPGTAANETTAPSRASTTIGLIQWWQAEEADVYTREVNDKVPFMHAAEMLITDKNAADGSVAYALYRRQMPVLSLAATHLPARSSLQRLLFIEAAEESVEGQRAAIQQFLSFPKERGTYTVGPPSGAPVAAVVVRVNADGYPVELPHAAPSSTAGAESTALLPPPPTLFANVLAELQSSSNAHLDVLRRRNPLLPGILEAFHRYQNRGVVRAALHRGYHVEVAPKAAAASLAWVQKFVTDAGEGNAADAVTMAAAESTLARFESHWLELPLAQRNA